MGTLFTSFIVKWLTSSIYESYMTLLWHEQGGLIILFWCFISENNCYWNQVNFVTSTKQKWNYHILRNLHRSHAITFFRMLIVVELCLIFHLFLFCFVLIACVFLALFSLPNNPVNQLHNTYTKMITFNTWTLSIKKKSFLIKISRQRNPLIIIQ